MSTAQERLDLYLAAEARILTAGFSVRFDIRQRQEAELAEIRKAIKELKGEVAADAGTPPSRGSLKYKTATFC